MESLGRKLREAREKHSYNLEQIARDTNISKAYLEALEEENFGVIPGDTYVLGFLRNYGEYLGLNPEELVGLYRNLRIQEQPMPMSELLQGPRARPRPRLLALILAVLVVAGVGVFLLVRYGLPRRAEVAAKPAETRTVGAAGGEYVLSEEAITRWYSQGESVSVPIDGRQYRMSFAQVGDRLTLRIPGGTVDLTIGQTRQVDLDGDLSADIRAQLNDLDVTGSNRRANLSIYRLPKTAEGLTAQAGAEPGKEAGPGAEGAPAAGAATVGSAPAAAAPAGAGATRGAVAAVATPAAPSATPATAAEAEPSGAPATGGTASSGPQDLQAADSPAPFRLSISFRGYVLLRYLADGETRDERFFHKGETFSLDVRREARLWISNAGALRLSVAGKDVELGRPGEVVTRTIRWAQSPETSGYLLQVLPSD
jgi:cytoskeleton protein RodZ